MSKSKMVKAIIQNAVIITAIESKDIVNKAIKTHGLSPVGAIALGRALTMVALMSDDLKNTKDRLSATIDGDGPLGLMNVCVNGKGQVKATIENPLVEGQTRADGTLDVGQAVGKTGALRVIKDLGMKQNYCGTTRLVSGEIAQDFAYYYAESEQQPCGITLGVGLDNKKCKSAGGVMLKVMPNCPSDLLFDLETVMYAMDEMSYQFENSTAEQVIMRFFSEYNPVFVEEKEIEYKCNCSKRNMDKIVKKVGKAECYQILEEMGFLEIVCHFCNKRYVYHKEDLDKLFE